MTLQLLLRDSLLQKSVNVVVANFTAETNFQPSYLRVWECSWTVNLAVKGELTKFKVDTGAEATAITESALTQLGKLLLHQAIKTLCG